MSMGMKKQNEYSDLFDSDGHLTEEGLALAVDAMMLGKISYLPAPVQDHMTDCADCRKDIASLYDLVFENKELHPRVYHPLFDKNMEDPLPEKGTFSLAAKFFQRLRSPWGIAATLLVLVAIGGTWYFAVTSGNEEERIRQEIVGMMETDSDKLNGNMSTEETLQYANNQPDHRLATAPGNPRLEAMLRLRLRGNDFKMTSPEKNTIVRRMDKIVFAWEASGSPATLNLLVIDEQGVNRAQIPLKNKRYQFTVKLPEGLYYWVIVGDGALMSAGKISVTND